MAEIAISVASKVAVPKETWIPSYKGYEAFESRKSTLENILKAFNDPNVKMVGIYGVGGIGKSTLARAVAKHAADDKIFDVVAFTEVSAIPDTRILEGEIADMMDLTFGEEIIGRAWTLHEQEKKILLVLDNIWDKAEIPFCGGSKGCKVLLTTRDLNALTLTGAQHNFSIDVLNGQEAWNLFSTAADNCVEQRELQHLAKTVANACGGLPIAIVTIAKALRNKKVTEWRNALQELKNPSPSTLQGVARQTCSCIEFSYNQLNSEELRAIFLLCSVMKSTYDASVEDLVKYVMGLGEFGSIGRIEEMQDRVDTLVRRLKDAALLYDIPNKESISIHDIVRDIGKLIASRNQYVVIMMNDNVRENWYDKEVLTTSTRIFLHNVTKPPEGLRCPDLQFLYMETTNDVLKIPANFFAGMSKLRVLHFVGFDLMPLPTSLRVLTNLRMLCMEKGKVQEIELIGELKKLN